MERERTTWTKLDRDPCTVPAEEVDTILDGLDRLSAALMNDQKGMDFDDAKLIVNALDKLADTLELAAYGAVSFERRKQKLYVNGAAKDESESEPQAAADQIAQMQQMVGQIQLMLQQAESAAPKARLTAEEASHKVLAKKSELALDTAKLMLAGKKIPSVDTIEDQAFSLMFMPDEELIATHRRLTPVGDGVEGE